MSKLKKSLITSVFVIYIATIGNSFALDDKRPEAPKIISITNDGQTPVRVVDRPNGIVDYDTGTVVYESLNHSKQFELNNPKQRGIIYLHAFVKLIRGDNNSKYLHIDLNGSTISASDDIDGKIGKDTKRNRGWYLENARISFIPMRAEIQLVKSADFSDGGETGVVTSSISQTINASITNSLTGKISPVDPGITGETSGSLGYTSSIGHSYSKNLRAFKISTPNVRPIKELGNVTCVSNNYKLGAVQVKDGQGLKSYKSYKNLVDYEGTDVFWGGTGGLFSGTIWNSLQLHDLPDLAKQGLPIVSQVIFFAKNDFHDYVIFRIEVEVTLRKFEISGKTKFDSKGRTGATKINSIYEFVIDFGLI